MTHGRTTIAAPALQVLVVDDSQAQRTRVRSALEGAGLTVVGEAEDGAQALSEAAAHHPDVVLMDLCMPRMDGVQATRILRRQQPDTPVVLWTGDDEAQLERAVGNSGAQVGIPKDIGTGELVATLQDACAAQDEARPVAGGHSDSGVEASLEGLTAADWAALKQLEATHGYAMRWSVGRQVGRSLVNRRLVVVASDYVLLTQAGRRALASHSQHDSRSAPPDPDQTEVGASTRSARAARGSRGLRGGPGQREGKWSLAAGAIRYPRILRS
ncbi:MAG TPA: response regulator [Actinomycetes bacterium]|nr:response regulator [Actinomycetes bacterium]